MFSLREDEMRLKQSDGRISLIAVILLVVVTCVMPLAARFGQMATAQTNTFLLSSPPDWAKGVVWYEILTERFRNGDASNDPKVNDIEGARFLNPQYVDPSLWHIHPWASDWYKMQDYEYLAGTNFYNSVDQRRYGGDIRGIIDELGYLKNLGVGGIWLNPVYESPSVSKYDPKLYHHMDHNFGPDPEGDLRIMEREKAKPGGSYDPDNWEWTSADKLMLKLIKKAHEKGIRVIFDGVFNHMGMMSPAFQDVLWNAMHGSPATSAYYDWFDIIPPGSPDYLDPGPLDIFYPFEYWGWSPFPKRISDPQSPGHFIGDHGEPWLPELQEATNGFADRQVTEYFKAIAARWMTPGIVDGKQQEGIDGWRLDVPFMLNAGFWQEWSSYVLGLKDGILLVAEPLEPYVMVTDQEPLYTPDPSNPMSFISALHSPEFEGRETQARGFQSLMNYNFGNAVARYFAVGDLNTTQFDAYLERIRNAHFSSGGLDPNVVQNLISSLDTPRPLSFISNAATGMYIGQNFFGKGLLSTVKYNPYFNPTKPTEDARKIAKLAAIFQMTYVGAPMIYYGDEVGMWGAGDPDCRKPMLWEDITYEPELYLPNQSQLPAPGNSVEIDYDMLHHYRKLTSFRNNYPAIRLGDFTTLMADDAKEIYAFRRQYLDEKAIVVLNGSKLQQTVSLSVGLGKWVDLLNNENINAPSGQITLSIHPQWGRILVPMR